jgi:hypothetical protein
MTYLLHYDPNMIEVLETDLVNRVTAIAADADIDMGIQGVFSLDDLELLTTEDLCRHMAIGVSYLGAEDPAVGGPTTQTNAATKGLFTFIVVLAIPVTKAGSDNRLDGSKMLSVLRQQLHGKPVQVESPVQPCWAFVKEAPQPSESNNTMLYYSQLWRLVLPIATKKS